MTALAGAVVLIGFGSLAPTFLAMCALFAAGQSLIAVLTPGLTISFLSIVDARYRPHAAAVIGIFTGVAARCSASCSSRASTVGSASSARSCRW